MGRNQSFVVVPIPLEIGMLFSPGHDTFFRKKNFDVRTRIGTVPELEGVWKKSDGNWLSGNLPLNIMLAHIPSGNL